MSRPRILFVVYGGGHVNTVVPVIRRLRQEDWADLTVVGLTTAAPVLRREGIPFVGFQDFLEPGDQDALAVGRRLSADLPADGPVALSESQAYLGINYHELVSQHGAEEAERLYRQEGRMCFLPLRFLERIFDRVQPDLVVATNSPRAEQAALEVAMARGIRSLCVKDHLGTWEMWRLCQPGYGGTLCVFSETVKRDLVERGRPAEEIVVTGNPDFDRLSRPHLTAEAARWRESQGWSGKRVIVWASILWQYEPDVPARIEESLLAGCARNPEWVLVVRPHPSENRDRDTLPPRAVLSSRDDDLALLLAASDVVVTILSTVGLQTRLLGKRMISVVPPCGVTDENMYERHSLATRFLRETDGVGQAVEEALREPERYPEGFPLVGTATENVLNVIRRKLGR